MSGLLATPAALAVAIDRSKRELASRLTELNQAHALRKLDLAKYVAAAFFELIDHQTQFNQAVADELAAQNAALRAQLQSLQSVATRVPHG